MTLTAPSAVPITNVDASSGLKPASLPSSASAVSTVDNFVAFRHVTVSGHGHIHLNRNVGVLGEARVRDSAGCSFP